MTLICLSVVFMKCKPINPSTTKTAPATINQCAYCIAEPPSRSSFLGLQPEIDQAANYRFALSFLTSLSSHPRKRSDPSRAYSCETRVLQKGRTCRHAYRLPWPQARRRGGGTWYRRKSKRSSLVPLELALSPMRVLAR